MGLIIANDGPLGAEWSDHALSHDWQGYRECHVGGEFLLIYELMPDGGVVFVRTGKHTDLFKKS